MHAPPSHVMLPCHASVSTLRISYCLFPFLESLHSNQPDLWFTHVESIRPYWGGSWISASVISSGTQCRDMACQRVSYQNPCSTLPSCTYRHHWRFAFFPLAGGNGKEWHFLSVENQWHSEPLFWLNYVVSLRYVGTKVEDCSLNPTHSEIYWWHHIYYTSEMLLNKWINKCKLYHKLKT